MTRLKMDTTALEQLGPSTSVVEVCNDAGQIVGYFFPIATNGGTPKSPFSDEEIQKRRQQKSGRLLADVLREMKQP